MISALFSLSGRLNRAPFWGYSILLIVVGAIVQLIVMSSAMGPTLTVIGNQLQNGQTPSMTEVMAMFTNMGAQIGWLALFLQLVFSYPAAALSVKRRHDRNRSGIDVWIYIGLGLLVTVLGLLGIEMTTTTVQGVTVPAPEQWMQLVQLAMFIYAIYLFIVLAFLKGTVGPNAYGPDPLQG